MNVEIVWAHANGLPDQADDLLRHEISRACCLEVSIGRHCPRCGSAEHGRPVAFSDGQPMPASISRTRDVVVVAFGTDLPIGIDIERADATGFTGFDAVALHPDQLASGSRERAIIWARKESLLKATGLGLSVDMRTIRLTAAAEEPGVLSSDLPEIETVWMCDFVVGEAHVGALTVLGSPDGFSVREAPEVLPG